MRLLRIFLSLLLLASPGMAGARWLRAESAHFIVYGEENERVLRQRVSELEDYHGLLKLLTGAEEVPSPKLSVYLTRGSSGLATIWPGVPRIAAGFYRTPPGAIHAAVDMSARIDEPGAPSSRGAFPILFHEYAHHFMYQYFPVAYPPWYVEGFAEFMSATRFDGQTIEYGGILPLRSYWVVDTREWIDMERLLFERERIRTNEDVAKFYAQSWILVHYLLRDPARRTALNRYLAAYGRGEDPRQAFRTAFGMEPRDLNRDLLRYVRGPGIRVTRFTRTNMAAGPEVRVSSLPPSADSLLLLEASLRADQRGDHSARRLQQVRAAASRFPDDRYAQRVMALAELVHGDRAAAERLLTPLLAVSPQDADLLYLMGRRHSDEDTPEGRQASQRWYVRAYRANPQHYAALYALAEAKQDGPDFTSENNANVLLLAHQLAPQVANIRFTAAYVLMHRDQFETAQALLMPLANDPHFGGRDLATEWLTMARARQRPPSPVEVEETAE